MPALNWLRLIHTMLNLFVQFLLFYLMLLIGLSLTVADLKRVRENPKLIITVTLAQLLFLPIIALGLISFFEPPKVVAVGMMLVSVCPGGALSNFYSLIARADAALSLTLTATSSFVSIFLLPLMLLWFYPQFMAESENMMAAAKVVALKQVLMLVLTLLLPVLLGMWLRWKIAVRLVGVLPALEKFGFFLLVALLCAIFLKHFYLIGDQLAVLAVMALVFSLLAMMMAFIVSCFFVKNFALTLLLEFPVRNMAVAATLALSLFGSAEYLLFAALFLAVQTPLMLILVWWGRRNTNQISEVFPTAVR